MDFSPLSSMQQNFALRKRDPIRMFFNKHGLTHYRLKTACFQVVIEFFTWMKYTFIITKQTKTRRIHALPDSGRALDSGLRQVA